MSDTGRQAPAPPTPGEMAADIDRLSFEEALAELDRIVRSLEGGQMKLEDAISSYERGTLLRHHCEQKLAQAENRVSAIVQRTDGTFTTRGVE